MDESLRNILRRVDDSDPSSFLVAARTLERAGADAHICGDLLERLLKVYDAVYTRTADVVFGIAWMLRGVDRRTLNVSVQAGGNLLVHPGQPGLAVTLRSPTLSFLFQLIVNQRRLAPSTQRFVQVLTEAIARNKVVSSEEISVQTDRDYFKVERCFDVMAKRDPNRPWHEDYHLRFCLIRSLYRDLLEVSIENTLYWGTPDEATGIRLTGTSFTMYGGTHPDERDPPEYEDPQHPFSNYEIVHNLAHLSGLVDEIFRRFREQI